MKFKQLLILSIGILVTSNSALAGTADNFPHLKNVFTNGNIPNYDDWNFSTSNETESLDKDHDRTHTLAASDTGNLALQHIFKEDSTSYETNAFASYNHFATFKSKTDILNAEDHVTGKTHDYDARSFAFNSALLSELKEDLLTGGLHGESVYLYDAYLLSKISISNLATLIKDLENGSLGNPTASGINAATAVPVPFSGLLFSTGIITWLSFKRRHVA
jgi:hypothetical protein